MPALDYPIRSFTRRCAVSQRPIEPGQGYYSVIVEEGDSINRCDIGAEAWNGPPDEALGWWRSEVARPDGAKAAAPNEVLLELLRQWDGQPERHELRYVLALLLLRRKVLRLDDRIVLFAPSEADESIDDADEDQAWLHFTTVGGGDRIAVAVVRPCEERRSELQTSLSAIVYGHGEASVTATDG